MLKSCSGLTIMNMYTTSTDVTRQRFKTIRRGSSQEQINTSAFRITFQFTTWLWKQKMGERKIKSGKSRKIKSAFSVFHFVGTKKKLSINNSRSPVSNIKVCLLSFVLSTKAKAFGLDEAGRFDARYGNYCCLVALSKTLFHFLHFKPP